MGTLISPVDEVDSIHWSRVRKGRRLKAEAVVIVPEGDGNRDLLVAKLADGSFVCSRDLSRVAILPGENPFSTAVTKALHLIGAISKKAMDDHLAVCARRSERQSKQYAADRLRDVLAEMGLAATEEQQAFIDAHGTPPKRLEAIKALGS